MMANRIFTVIDDQHVYLPGELSRKILLMLDGGSLHQARQVCQGWNEAVINLVWGNRKAVERKLENNWRFAEPHKVERTLELDGFAVNLVNLTPDRAIAIGRKDDEEEENQVKIVEFNTKEWKVVSAIDVTDSSLPEDYPSFARLVQNSIVMIWGEGEDPTRVFACNLQSQQITFDSVVDSRLSPVFNETTKEIHIGRNKLKFTDANVEHEIVSVENYLPKIVVLQSNLCLTRSAEGMKLWRYKVNNYEEICVLHGSMVQFDNLFKFYPDTSRIVSVSPLSVSIWNFETGDLIEEEQLQQSECDELGDDEFIDADLVSLMIEGNHLVMLSIENYFSDHHYSLSHIVIYELDKVLAGEYPAPRTIALGDVDPADRFEFLMVDKTSISVAKESGSVVKLDFWRCQ